MKVWETIGIVGGGQLGRMLTLAALPLGFKVVVVDPSPNCPAAQAGAEEITADLYDAKALKKLSELADYITVEIEHLETEELAKLAASGIKVNPAPSTIKLIQDKYLQKKFLRESGVPVADFVEITDEFSALTALDQFGGSMLVKTRKGAYDGRGNMLVKSTEDLASALDIFKGKDLYAESRVEFSNELATMVARSMDGKVTVYPIVETIHERNICLEVLAPAPVSNSARSKAKQVALKVANLLEGAGTFGIEMFLTKSGEILVNEIAPRVHNSGHYTTEATRTSQFEQHIRAISGLPLGEVDMLTPAAAMVNVLGERNGPTRLQGMSKTLAVPHASVHLYGKTPTKVDRKMGHITATGSTLDEARDRARQARKHLKI